MWTTATQKCEVHFCVAGSPSVVDGDSLADIDVDHLNRG